jgi:hypothetical protein
MSLGRVIRAAAAARRSAAPAVTAAVAAKGRGVAPPGSVVPARLVATWNGR